VQLFRKSARDCSLLNTGDQLNDEVTKIAFCDDGEHETNILVASTIFGRNQRAVIVPIWVSSCIPALLHGVSRDAARAWQERGVWDDPGNGTYTPPDVVQFFCHIYIFDLSS
jgi:hypothetical protein